MRPHSLMVAATGLLLLAATMGGAGEPSKAQAARAGDFTISGPYTHTNLTIFLIHGKDTIRGKQFLTLQEALAQKKVVVHETQNVNELSVENVSPDTEVFVQSGDIVKGGQQDRVLSYDLIVSAKSGKVPIAAFCVEHGRWQQRGGENVARFDLSVNNYNGTADFKRAVNYTRSQGVVWNKVHEAQEKLGKKVGKSLAAKASPTSLELTLEDKDLLKTIDQYVKELAKAPEGSKDVIGYALAINGKVESADVYGSAALFHKLWPRLIQASATEALAELEKGKQFKPARAEAVAAFLADAGKGKQKDQDLSKRVHAVTRETPRNFLIETHDKDRGEVVHRNYVAK